MFPTVDERSSARERALYLLYEAQSKGISPTEAVELQVIHPGELTERLVVGVETHQSELDAHIARTADGWTLERMPVIDLNVMRLALYELIERPDVPTAVVLDEAVELAKQFSTDDSGRFVNGVLAALVPELRESDRQPAADNDASRDGLDIPTEPVTGEETVTEAIGSEQTGGE